jgi:hypothetical protein
MITAMTSAALCTPLRMLKIFSSSLRWSTISSMPSVPLYLA